MKNSARPIDTHWIAITGAPSSGKTALVDVLRNKYGMRTSPDYARRVLEQAKLDGHSLDDFKANPTYYQNIIVKTRLEALYQENPFVSLVHDYGLPCFQAWGETNNVPTLPELEKACRLFQYAYVFLLEPLDIQNDPVRIGDNTLHRKFLINLEKIYKMYGYTPVLVPRFSQNKQRSNTMRAEFIREYMANQNKTRQALKTQKINHPMPNTQEA